MILSSAVCGLMGKSIERVLFKTSRRVRRSLSHPTPLDRVERHTRRVRVTQCHDAPSDGYVVGILDSGCDEHHNAGPWGCAGFDARSGQDDCASLPQYQDAPCP